MSDENQSLEERVRAIVARTFELDCDSVTPELARGRLQAWDSMGHLNLMMEIERAFNVRFTTNQLQETDTVGKLHVLLKQLSPVL